MQKLLSFGFTVYLNSVGGEVSPLPLLQHVVGRVQPAVGNNLLKSRSFPRIKAIVAIAIAIKTMINPSRFQPIVSHDMGHPKQLSKDTFSAKSLFNYSFFKKNIIGKSFQEDLNHDLKFAFIKFFQIMSKREHTKGIKI